MCTSCDCKCKKDDFPADWAIERAISLQQEEKFPFETTPPTVSRVKKGIWPTLTALARYIEKHEKPPVSSELKAARKYAAAQSQFASMKAKILSGEVDGGNKSVLGFLAGIDWARSNNG